MNNFQVFTASILPFLSTCLSCERNDQLVADDEREDVVS